MTKDLARWALLALATVGVLEAALAVRSYRSAIGGEAWSDAREAIDAAAPDTARLAQRWLGPRARLEIPALAGPRAAAGPDLHGISTLGVLGYDGARWSDDLERELGGRRHPNLVRERHIGALTWAEYAFDPGQRTLEDWVETPPTLSTASGGCKRRGTWKCKDAIARLEYAEIDYKPRRCINVIADDGAAVTLRQEDMPLGSRLRGHVGFSDFNARLRSDAPVRVRARIAGEPVADFVVTDAQGWRAFELETSGGRGTVEVELLSAVRGTWGRTGYQPRAQRSLCVELRTIEDEP